MAVYSLFAPSTLGMRAQAYSLNVIGSNVANMTTGGFKGTDVRFQSVLSRTLFEQSDLGGVRPHDLVTIDRQGPLVATSRALDVGINGKGFFLLNSEVDGSGKELYTRDGAFEMRVGDPITRTDDDGNTFTSNEAYLVDKNGYYVMGAARQTDGTFDIPGTMEAIRLDTYAFSDVSEATTDASLRLNLPAGADSGDSVQYNITAVDSAGTLQSPELLFTKAGGNNRWHLTSSALPQVQQVDTLTLGGTLEAGDVYSVRIGANTATYTVTGLEADINAVATNLAAAVNGHAQMSGVVTAAGLGTGGQLTLTADTAATAFTTSIGVTNGGATADNTASATTTTEIGPVLSFTENGVYTGTSPTLDFTFSGGATASLALELSAMTQYDADFTVFNYSRNGFASADLQSYAFDEKGHIIGQFGDSSSRAIYKLPLAQFTNPNGLEVLNGQVFAQGQNSGESFLVAADANGYATFTPNAHEMANVDLEVEFSRMIVTQNAYNSSATVFKTVDEMTETARDLKR